MHSSKNMILLVMSTMFFSGIVFASPTNDSTSAKVKILSDKKAVLKEVKQLPKVIKEASGLESSPGSFLWTHNDDGIPALYCLDTLGNLIRAVQLNARNQGWEDLTQDDNGNFFIGGFGNNTNDKKELKIYKIPPPETITATITTPEIIRYRYSDQTAYPPDKMRKNFDVDAFFAWEDFLYLFTKDRSVPFTGYSKIYRLNQTDLEQTAVLIDSIFVGKGPMINNWITSVDISPDKKTLALLLHDRILFIKGFTQKKFSSGRMFQLSLNHYSHKAGLCFLTNDKIKIVDEFEMGLLGGKLYSLDLRPILNEFKP